MSFRAVLAVAALAVAAPAFAQSGQPTDPQAGAAPSSSPMAAVREQVRKACAADLKTYCSDPQGGRMGQCLRQNFDKLSPDCKTQLEQMRAQWRERRPQ